jgi:hypothetical protein
MKDLIKTINDHRAEYHNATDKWAIANDIWMMFDHCPMTIEEIETTLEMAPKAGDTINVYGTEIVLSEDMRPGTDWLWDKSKGEYIPSPRMTSESTPRPVYYADGYSWRPGEWFASATETVNA